MLAILDIADEIGLLQFEAAVSRLLKTSFHVEKTLLESIRSKVRERSSA